MRTLEELKQQAGRLGRAMYVEPRELEVLTEAGATKQAEGERATQLGGERTSVFKLDNLQFFTLSSSAGSVPQRLPSPTSIVSDEKSRLFLFLFV